MARSRRRSRVGGWGWPDAVVTRRLSRNVLALGAVSFFTDASSEMIFPLLPLFVTTTLGATPLFLGAIEGAADSVSALLKLASGWLSDRMRRKPLVVAGYTLASAVRPLVAMASTATQVLLIRVTDRVGKGIRGAPRDALIADSVEPSMRGRAFGFHRAADHAGAVVGPLVAYLLLVYAGVGVRVIFALAAIPAAVAVFVLVLFVREHSAVPRAVPDPAPSTPDVSRFSRARLGRPFFGYLAILLVFTLGNSTDAFLLLRASELGVAAGLVPVLWAMLHVVKSITSTPGGVLSDVVGRKPVIVTGWMVYAVVYLMFGYADSSWHAWMLFAAYGVFFGLTEGVERALVADLVPAEVRGTAYGWYNMALALGALPASLIFGGIYTHYGAPTAFAVGAGAAFVASVALWVVIPGPQHKD